MKTEDEIARSHRIASQLRELQQRNAQLDREIALVVEDGDVEVPRAAMELFVAAADLVAAGAARVATTRRPIGIRG